MTGQIDGSDDAGALRDLLTDHRGEVEPVLAQHYDEVLEGWDGRGITADEVRRNLVMLRRQLGLATDE
jgi:hypothetical protein